MPPNNKMIMSRVRAVYLARQIIKPFAMQIIGLSVLSIALLSLISIPNVIGNTLKLPSLGYAPEYLAKAFVHTQTFVQVISLLALGLTLLVFKNLIRRYFTVRVPFMPMAR